MMNYLPEDLWVSILLRLPLTSMSRSKLVCKEWKSMVESRFLRELFLSRHQNSHCSWLLMCRESHREVMAHYGCEVWGLARSLGSYVSSFLNHQFETQKEDGFPQVRAVSYTDVGLFLIKVKRSDTDGPTFYVANPISRECVEIPPPPHGFQRYFEHSGLATRIENGVILGYTVVLVKRRYFRELLVYSSETGLWSFETLHCPLPLGHLVHCDPVSLNGNLYWLGCIASPSREEVVVSHDFYAESDDHQYRVVLFPDSEKEVSFRRACTPSQGYLMYMNADASSEHRLRVWRLETGEWQLLSEVSLACIKTVLDYFPLAANPFDADTVYIQSDMHSCLASTNLHRGMFGLHNNSERRSDGSILSFAGEWKPTALEGPHSHYNTFVLPRWLYRIPSDRTRDKI